MVYITTIVPAQHKVAIVVAESVIVEDVLIDRVERLKIKRAEFSV